MDGYVGDDQGALRRVTRIWVCDAQGVRRDVRKAWVGDDAGVPRLWYDRYGTYSVDLVVGPSVVWSAMPVSWTSVGAEIDGYRLYRNGVLIYQGPETSFLDTGVSGSTTYTYTVEAMAGPVVAATDTEQGTTALGGTVDLTFGGSTFYSITMNWTMTGSIATYRLWRGTVKVYEGPATTFTDTNLAALTAYEYRLEGLLVPAGEVVAQDTATGITEQVPTITLSQSSKTWDSVTMAWTGGYSYRLYRSGSLIYQGPATSFKDTVLFPSSTYSYRLDVVTPDGVVRIQRTADGTTDARAAMSFSGSPRDGSSVNYSFSDPNTPSAGQSNVWHLRTDTSGWAGPLRDHSTPSASGWVGVPWHSARYVFTLIAYRNGAEVARATMSTNSYYQRYGSANSDQGGGGLGWRQCTATTMQGYNVTLPVSCRVYQADFYAYGHGTNARFEPFISGVSGGNDQIRGPAQQWNGFAFDCDFGAGTHSTALRIGGCSTGEQGHDGCRGGNDAQGVISMWGYAEWAAKAGQDWRYTVRSGTVHYWYWSSAPANEELRRFPWWREEFEGRDTHLATRNDEDGAITEAVITDRITGETLVDWSL